MQCGNAGQRDDSCSTWDGRGHCEIPWHNSECDLKFLNYLFLVFFIQYFWTTDTRESETMDKGDHCIFPIWVNWNSESKMKLSALSKSQIFLMADLSDSWAEFPYYLNLFLSVKAVLRLTVHHWVLQNWGILREHSHVHIWSRPLPQAMEVSDDHCSESSLCWYQASQTDSSGILGPASASFENVLEM
jgi:hypothetical protein